MTYNFFCNLIQPVGMMFPPTHYPLVCIKLQCTIPFKCLSHSLNDLYSAVNHENLAPVNYKLINMIINNTCLVYY